MNKKNKITLVILCSLFVMFSKNVNVKAISQSQARAIIEYSGANGTEYYTSLSSGCDQEVAYFTIGGERFYDTVSPGEIAKLVCGSNDSSGCLPAQTLAAQNKIATIQNAALNQGFARQNDGSYAKKTGNYPIGCYRSSYSGVRVSIVNEDGTKKSGTNTIDYWQSNPGILIGNIQKSNNLRTIIVNGANANFQTVPSIGGTIDSKMGNYSSARNTLKSEVIESSNSKVIKNNGYLNQLGINKWEDFDEDDHILFEPLFVVTIGRINYVGTGTEIFSLLMQHPEATWIRADFIKTITNQMTLTDMKNEPKDDKDMTYTLNSNGTKYVPYNQLEQSSNGLKNNPSLVLNQANGYAMELIWLKPYLKLEECCEPTKENEWCCDESNTLICGDNGTQTWDEYWDNHDEQHTWDLVCSSCCIPCDPDDEVCIETSNDPYCCLEKNEISEDGTLATCVPADEYWNNHEYIYEEYCEPKCDPNTENCCDEPGWCDQPENKAYCEEFCTIKCPPLQLNGTSYCKAADCDGENNVSVFADPILSEFVKNGSADAEEIINKFSNLTEEQVKDLIAPEVNTFLAVAEVGGETYKETINQYCDMYCQEIAIVTLPDVYPAANAGRYFQWGISGEDPGTLVTQEIVKVCAEDIKYDDFMRNYIGFNEETTSKIDAAVNFKVYGGECYCGALDFTGSGFTREMIGARAYSCCIGKCGEAMEACMNAAKDDTDAQADCKAEYESCQNDCPDTAAGYEEAYDDAKTDWESLMTEFANGGHSFKDAFNYLLECFNNDLNGNKIETELQINLKYGDNYYDSDSYDIIGSDSNQNINNDAKFYCLSADDCNLMSYFSINNVFSKITDFCGDDSFYPRDLYKDANKIANDLGNLQQKLNEIKNKKTTAILPKILIEIVSTQTNTNHLGEVTYGSIKYKTEIDFSDFDKKLSELGGTDYGTILEQAMNSAGEHANEARNSVENSLGKANSQLSDYIDSTTVEDYYVCALILGPYLNEDYIREAFPQCNDYYAKITSTGGVVMTSLTTVDTANSCYVIDDIYKDFTYSNFPLTVTSYTTAYDNEGQKWGIDDYTNSLSGGIDYQNTLRLFVLSKTDKYQLKDNINACTCSDGTVMDAVVDDDTGTFICDCEPEENVTNNGDYSYSDSGAILIEKENYGICKYWAYSTNTVGGGNYTVKYMTGSGTYPLTIEYSNIGSTDEYGAGHFNNMPEICNCPGGTCVYDGDACKLVVGNYIMQDSWPEETVSQGWSSSSKYFVCKSGNCWDPDKYPICKDGDCPPDFSCPPTECPPDKEDDEFKCDDCIGLSLVYRTIDLDNPFPGDDIDSERTAGENWLGQESKITNNRGLNGNQLYSSNEVQPLYYFKFTPSLIKEIRAYNVNRGRDYATSSTIAYPNNRLTNDDGSYNVGISQPLRNDIGSIVADTAFANGDELDEWFKVPVSEEECREGYIEVNNVEVEGDRWCYEIAKSWEEISSSKIYQGDEACWDLASAYLGVNR